MCQVGRSSTRRSDRWWPRSWKIRMPRCPALSASRRSVSSAQQPSVTMMRSAAVKAFNLQEEPAALRDAYGRNLFGQGCLLARRLVERGVPFVEVTLSGVPGAPGVAWDTHARNFETVKTLSQVL